ncbi:MAG: hypothetical protein EPN20_09125 [Magnetospirillum sp.]|nr:MAG: hypothetical protein EPN20_09125 [Magnetospirillum sp.]
MRLKTLIFALALMALPGIAVADQASALEAVRANSGVLDARIDDRGNLWVMVVKNNKVAWDQYAAYLCSVVRPHQARVFITHIVDVTSVGGGKKQSEWKQLAAANCGK